MEPRLDCFHSGQDAMKAMAGLEQHIARSGLEKPLVELVRLRASQVNGCANCVDVHDGAAARKTDESVRQNERRRVRQPLREPLVPRAGVLGGLPV